MTCVDRAQVTPEYKMLQLRQYVAAYETAKDSLERKYGGKRRQKASFMEDLEQFQ